MESLDLPEKSGRKLSNAVAMTVVILSVFMAISKIKDDNIVQAMQVAKADAVDTWSEYQASKIKLHISENSVRLLKIQSVDSQRQEAMKGELALLDNAIQKYATGSKDLYTKAKKFEADYDALNFRDDQFDLSDALLAIALSAAAVSSLVELWWLLVFSWGMGAGGIVMGLAGFLGWGVHPEWIVKILT